MSYVTGKTIRELREKRKLTQRELAERIHVSDKAVSKWETGKGLPDIGILEDLAKALGISIAELLTGELRINENQSANMRKTLFYVCPVCGNVITSVGKCSFSCCGILLPECEPEQAEAKHVSLSAENQSEPNNISPSAESQPEADRISLSAENQSEANRISLSAENQAETNNISLSAENHSGTDKVDSLGTEHVIKVEQIENEYFVTMKHIMSKSHYISFVAYVTSDGVAIEKLYPEQDIAVRFRRKGHGFLYAYCNRHGLFRVTI